MLSYQHTYHAGCFADVIKHLVLTNMLDYMVQKDKPLVYLDTHAGRGCYDLKDEHALKTQEASWGIEALWKVRKELPIEFSSYISTILQYNPDGLLRYYPGSPALAIKRLRAKDRIVCSELHPGEYDHLYDFLGHRGQVHCANKDGYLALKALVPPIERRGLIMIDPSYEVKNEYRQVTQAVKSAYHIFQTGVYCIWYPLVDNKLHGQLMRGFNEIGAEKNLRAEFYLNSKTQPGMSGCGLWIINPPFLLKKQITSIFELLKSVFHPGRSTYLIE